MDRRVDLVEGASNGWIWFAAGVVILQLLYLLLPTDLVPDLIPVVGWIDDFFVLMGGICAVAVGSYLIRARGAALDAQRGAALDGSDGSSLGDEWYEPLSPEEIRSL